MKQYSKHEIATAIAVLFHTIGVVGILVLKSELIIRCTALNLLLSFTLLIWVQAEKNISFWLFAVASVIIGFAAEVIGVNSGWLFGNYAYGNVLGPKFLQVPFIIGINWFIIIFCCGISMKTLLQKIIQPLDKSPSPALKAVSVITDSATLAVFFDWLMEPVAVKLGFWQWKNETIPLFNYACWFAISVLLLIIFHCCKFQKQNKFAINLLLIQIMFFLLLRTFY